MTRIAIVSTPRSGNTWVRSVLAHALALEQVAVHNPRDLPEILPKRVILQIHWYREPNFQAWLRNEGFQVLVLARHPLDVLLSALSFVQREPDVRRWLAGNTQLPAGLAKLTPVSPGFGAYATSFGAENLLSVSYQWWHEPDVVTARFEDLVEAPAAGFPKLVRGLCGPAHDAALLEGALQIDWLKIHKDMPNRHGWHGKSGLWRQLVTPGLARRIYRRHRLVFDTLGYRVPLNLLSHGAAARNWRRLA